MNELNITIGKRIRDLRLRYGYTREQLAELAGINDKFLYEVETGRKGLSAQTMYKLSRSLGVTMEYFVCNEQNHEKCEVILSLLSVFNEIEIKQIEVILRQIIAISKSNLE